MLTLVLFAVLSLQPTPEAPAGPSVSAPPTVTGVCPEGCACPFPGACGHEGCKCQPAAGWKPPAEEWRPYDRNPAWEVFGREVLVDGKMIFQYTQSRLRRVYRHTFRVYAVEPANLFRKTRVVLHRVDLKPGERGLFVETDDPAALELFRAGKTVVVTVSPGG